MKEPAQFKAPPWQVGGLSPGDIAWLSKQFEQLDKANLVIGEGIGDLKKTSGLILARLDELEAESGPDSLVIPELEAEVQRATLMSKKIDEQVPDQ